MQKIKKHSLLILIGVGILLFLLFQWKKYRIAPVVDFLKTPLEDTAGNKFIPENLPAAKVLVTFFATWCGDCLGELKEIAAAQEAGKLKTRVFAVSDESLEKIKSFAKRKGYDITFLKLQTSFHENSIYSIPVNYVIDKDRSVILSRVGSLNFRDPSVISILSNPE